jgi:hypothetical protein
MSIRKQSRLRVANFRGQILAPDESMVLTNVNRSIAKKFVEAPVSTLKGLGRKKLQERADRIAKSLRGDPKT